MTAKRKFRQSPEEKAALAEAANRPAREPKKIVALSGGADSSSLALWLVANDPNGARDYTFVCTPTGDENAEMFAWWIKLGELLGKPLLPVMNVKAGTLNTLIDKYDSLPSRRQRWCTRELKIEPYRLWLINNGPAISYVGLRADEEGRAGGAYDDIPGIEMRFPLREMGWGRQDVLDYLASRGVLEMIPERTDCLRCYHQQIGEWFRWWKNDPEAFETAVEQERVTGGTFRVPKIVDDAPVMTTRFAKAYPASHRDSWPVRLADMRELWETGIIPPTAWKQGSIFGDRQTGACRVCTL